VQYLKLLRDAILSSHIAFRSIGCVKKMIRSPLTTFLFQRGLRGDRQGLGVQVLRYRYKPDFQQFSAE
jgi:hypothetical protein